MVDAIGRVVDDIDLSQQREQHARELALLAHARRARAVTPADGCCVECGEAIEAARIRVLGQTEHCAECARLIERREAHRA